MAIRAMSSRIPATVEAFGRLKEGSYGPYQSVLFKGDGLPEGQIWRSMKPEEAKQFSRGQSVYLAPTYRDGKETWDIELIDQAPTNNVVAMPQRPNAPAPTLRPQRQVQAAQASPEVPHAAPSREQIEAYIGSSARLFAHCYAEAARNLPPGCSPEDLRAIATTLFIQVARKFQL